MNRLSLYISDSFDVFRNQALESYFLSEVREGEVILYLWRNENMVVIGKNQDAYSECDVKTLEEENGCLARRISGGGAVYHDTGNLNFTFLSSAEDFDVGRQDDVLLKALRDLGIWAEKNGRNDLLIDGRKFSGHAYHKGKKACLHHGTLMLEVDEEKLSKYLHVSKLKLRSKNVSSVKSRIINLKSVKEDLDVAMLQEALIKAAEAVYEVPASRIAKIDEEKIEGLRKKFADPSWRYGKTYEFPYVKEGRFDWGTVKVCFAVKEDVIEDAVIYSDALDETLFDGFAKRLIGKKLSEAGSEKEEEREVISLMKEVEL
ncbi:MAG: lipoate--protein ligase [Erysipelotrichaceae bacterium]|nr:lipoate--protein ligase [Erysipelotrichaceae bacterium]